MIDTAALVGAFVLVKLDTGLIVVSCLIIAGGFVFFGIVAYIGIYGLHVLFLHQ